MAEKHADDVVRLAEAANPSEAQLWCQVLEEAGIRCRVVGDFLEAGFGELPKVHPEVWVHRGDLERAKELLKTTRAAKWSTEETDDETENE